jgi:hypothetical protein
MKLCLAEGCLSLKLEECRLHTKILFYRRISITKSSKHAAGSFMASDFRVRQFVRENSLVKRPYVSLWLKRTYVLPAGMYAGQVWGTEFIKGDKVFTSDLQVRHMSFLKSKLGIKC